MLLVLIFYVSNQREIRTRNAKITKWLMIAVLVSNTVNQSLNVVRWLVCGYCYFLWGSYFASRAIVKGCNLFFLIHRAKLVQGMSPIVSKKWFERILPAIIVVGITGLLFLVLREIGSYDFVCTHYEDWSDCSVCVHDLATDTDEDDENVLGALSIGVDALITIISPKILGANSKFWV